MKSSYSLYIKVLKIMMFLAGTLILGIMLFLPLIQKNQGKVQLKALAPELKVAKELTNQINNPTIYGKDNANRQYMLNGEYGIKLSEQQMELYKINGELQLAPQNKLTIKADKGVSYTEEKNILLRNNVLFSTTDNYHLSTQEITINYEEQSANSLVPVHITGNFGTLSSNKMRILPNMEIIYFTGNIRMVLAQ